MQHPDPETTFDDFEDDGPDDTVELERFAQEVAVAVEAFGVPVLEPGFEAS